MYFRFDGLKKMSRIWESGVDSNVAGFQAALSFRLFTRRCVTPSAKSGTISAF